MKSLSDKIVTDNEVIKCYGTIKNCDKVCRFKSACQNVIKEKAETLYISNHKPNYDEVLTELVNCDEFYNKIDNITDYDERIKTIDILHYFSFIYLKDNFLFDIIMRKSTQNLPQSDIAKDLGVSRQALNKRVRDKLKRLEITLGVRKELKKEVIEFLTAKELAVYKALVLDKKSERQTAQELNISKSTIHRMGQSLALKLAKMGQTKINNKKNITQS